MAEKLTDQETQQLQALANELSATKLGVAGVDICGTWKKIKPFWSIIVKAVGLIPGVGGTVATILTALGQALDAFCP